MTPPESDLSRLRRPGLLLRAARAGLTEYNRKRMLRRLLPDVATADVLQALLHRERLCEAERQSQSATYSVSRHVELLVALISEARLAERARA